MRVIPVTASTYRSDGGSMFGPAPKTMWSRKLAPDDRNRIAQHAHVLLIELEDGRKGIVDTGCGSAESFTEKQRSIHALGPGWPLIDALRQHGAAPEEIDFVILSHLHWDHAGGAGSPSGGEERALTFPNAMHYVHALEWEDATSGTPLLPKAYPGEVIAPIAKHADSSLHLVTEPSREIAPGIRMIRSGGHTRGHCTIILEGDDLAFGPHGSSARSTYPYAVFASDVCPTQHHLRLVFHTAYDTFPLDTRRWKLAWLPRIADERALLLFVHDPDVYGATITADDRHEFVVDDTIPVS